MQSHELEYDSNGNQTKTIYHNADGNIEGKVEYEYDSKGNTKKMTLYSWQPYTGNYTVILETTYTITYTNL
jgi:hypothetical protein